MEMSTTCFQGRGRRPDLELFDFVKLGVCASGSAGGVLDAHAVGTRVHVHHCDRFLSIARGSGGIIGRGACMIAPVVDGQKGFVGTGAGIVFGNGDLRIIKLGPPKAHGRSLHPNHHLLASRPANGYTAGNGVRSYLGAERKTIKPAGARIVRKSVEFNVRITGVPPAASSTRTP